MIATVFVSLFLLVFVYSLIAIILSDLGIKLFPFMNDENSYPKLRYKQFVDYYWVNPNRWFLCENYVEYIYIDKRIFANGGAHEIFTFSFVDMLKYKKFKHDIEVNNKLKTNKATYQILLKGVQEDIDKLRKQSEDELNQAINTMKEVKERIR